jgi:hypothetical protein
MVENKSITPSENGPYLTEGSIAVRRTDGQNLAEGKERVALGRCGFLSGLLGLAVGGEEL